MMYLLQRVPCCVLGKCKSELLRSPLFVFHVLLQASLRIISRKNKKDQSEALILLHLNCTQDGT